MPRSKTNRSRDGKHVEFGDDSRVPMPGDWFRPGGDAAVCSQWFGDVMENADGGGFGSAYHEPHDEDY